MGLLPGAAEARDADRVNWVGLGRQALAGGLLALFVSCARKAERKPIVSVDTRSGGNGGTGAKGGSSNSSGSSGKHDLPGANDGGVGNVESDPSSGGESGAVGGGDTAGGGRVGGGGLAGADGSGIPDDCSSDADCPRGHCITLSVGFRTCQSSPAEATECSPNPSQDDCCDSSDCTPGLSCFSTRAFNYDNQSEFNVCTSDECTRDSDCSNDTICVPKGTLGRPIAFCISAVCHSDADCTDDGAGRCVPMIDECSGGYWTFACAYARPGSCKTNADCSSDAPPFGPGERYCHLGSCSQVLAGTICE
jgi:hypothetical protein